MLVSRACPLREQADAARMIPVDERNPGILMETVAAGAFRALMNSIRGWGELMPVSGYRTREEQADIYESTRLERGEDFTRRFVALPDCSEHQTGLAVDMALIKPDIDEIAPDFGHDGICGAFRREAARFGFVERYPKGKEAVTGIGYEPWHFRYVGTPHAEIMRDGGLVLEEYLQMLREHRHGCAPLVCTHGRRRYEISFLPADPGGAPEFKAPGSLYVLSGDNMNGLVITAWS